MLHEILLSLSGHPSPLLRTAAAATDGFNATAVLSPSERALLASLARLSNLHVKLLSYTGQIAASHPSVICRAVATAIDSIHLAAFQRKVLEVEDGILRKDAGLVGAYNIVPLTAIVSEFDGGWTRRMQWLWELVQFMLNTASGSSPCTGPKVMDRLRSELRTGYMDVEETARSLVRVAEVAWLKQVSAWILYGKLPTFGAQDFCVQKSEDDSEEYVYITSLLPSFVTPSTAASMLFIGKSLNQIRAKSIGDARLRGTDHLSTQLKELAKLTHPLDAATFSRTITGVRHFLSRTTLQKLLPLSRVLEMLQLFREFFLLDRGEFAMALTQQADEKMRSRWKRADNLAAYEKRDSLGTVVVKEGEVAAVLGRTWAAMGSMQGQHADEDEGLELARDLLRLQLAKQRSTTTPSTPAERGLGSIAPTPFRNLLFSVPVILTLQIPSPLDLFLSQADLQTYTAINSYLLSIRRAHIRLTDLWKITSLRRHHPAPPTAPFGSSRAGEENVRLLRGRYTTRSNLLRSAWATASAAIFFLGETEGYLQSEVVAGLSDGFRQWLSTGEDKAQNQGGSSKHKPNAIAPDTKGDGGDDDIWLATTTTTTITPKPEQNNTGAGDVGGDGGGGGFNHDPQTLATAHRLYLRTLVRRLLLSQQSFTDPLYELLVHIDHLVALVHRLHGVWTAADLESDVGVVDAFVDLQREEEDVQAEIREVETRVKKGVEGLVAELRRLEAAGNNTEEEQTETDEDDGGGGLPEMSQYIPRRIGGVDRLLMKLDFGSWFGGAEGGGGGGGGGRGGFDDEDY